MRSMTGFGQVVAENERLRVTVRLRSVNHRGRDFSFRLPDECLQLEGRIRELLCSEVERGRVELAVTLQRLQRAEPKAELRTGMLLELVESLTELGRDERIDDRLTAGDLVRVPEAFRLSHNAESWDESDRELLLGAVGKALALLVTTREREGRRIAEALRERAERLQTAVRQLSQRRDEVRARLGERLEARLQELLAEAPLSEDRLAQEVAVLVERSDVAEELDRLEVHLERVLELANENTEVGRQLNFLSQEILRELNTLGSKCRDIELSHLTVDAKVLCEQLREQAQNVE